MFSCKSMDVSFSLLCFLFSAFLRGGCFGREEDENISLDMVFWALGIGIGIGPGPCALLYGV